MIIKVFFQLNEIPNTEFSSLHKLCSKIFPYSLQFDHTLFSQVLLKLCLIRKQRYCFEYHYVCSGFVKNKSTCLHVVLFVIQDLLFLKFLLQYFKGKFGAPYGVRGFSV